MQIDQELAEAFVRTWLSSSTVAEVTERMSQTTFQDWGLDEALGFAQELRELGVRLADDKNITTFELDEDELFDL